MAHPIVHIELSSEDHAKDVEWYKDVFGWETMEYPDMDYSAWSGVDDSVGGGFNPVSDDNPAGTIMVYIHYRQFGGDGGEDQGKGRHDCAGEL